MGSTPCHELRRRHYTGNVPRRTIVLFALFSGTPCHNLSRDGLFPLSGPDSVRRRRAATHEKQSARFIGRSVYVGVGEQVVFAFSDTRVFSPSPAVATPLLEPMPAGRRLWWCQLSVHLPRSAREPHRALFFIRFITNYLSIEYVASRFRYSRWNSISRSVCFCSSLFNSF